MAGEFSVGSEQWISRSFSCKQEVFPVLPISINLRVTLHREIIQSTVVAPSTLCKKLLFFVALELLVLLIHCVLGDWYLDLTGKLLPPGLEACTVHSHPASRRAVFIQKWPGYISKELVKFHSCKDQVICKSIFSGCRYASENGGCKWRLLLICWCN